MVKKRDPARSRKTILEAAQREIHRHGFRAASLSRILAATGLTKGAVYHHFPNKQALGYAVVEEVLARMVEEDWLRPLARADNPIDCLQEILAGFAARGDPEFILLGCPLNNLALEMSFEDQGFRIRVKDIYDRWQSGLSRALIRGREKGYVREGFEVEAVATFILAGLAGCRALAKNGRDGRVLEHCVKAMTGYWDSLRA